MPIHASDSQAAKRSPARFIHELLHGRHGRSRHGAIRWARSYDVVVQVVTLGRARRLRSTTLDHAGVFAGARLLDVGCGTGTLTLEAKRRCGGEGRVHGLDVSPQMIARARAKAADAGLDVTLEVASADALPFADESCDIVLCSLALHHLRRSQRRTAIAEMARVLAPGGRLVIVELSRESGLLAALNPVAFLHRGSGDVAAEAEVLLAEVGFRDVDGGEVGVRNLRFVRGVKASPPADTADHDA
jgi:ubiquinone/menaquinone biosynthesis C-methylase UbiE